VADNAGELVNGRYRLVEIVGIGAMGRVWRAQDVVLDREVAVKEVMLPPGVHGEKRAMLKQRAIREARSAARLSHPGIITVHDITEYHDSPAIIMELVPGRSLDEVLRSAGRLSPLRVAEIGLSLVRALQAAHEVGIVHRDLKPANVLLCDDRVIITDFGIASLTGEALLTKSGVLMGTPAFMAPEQARGSAVGPEADLWSLGATLYMAVEGHPPYEGADFLVVLTSLLTRSPQPTAHAGPLTELLSELLNPDVAARATTDRAAELLLQLVSEPQVEAVPPVPVWTAPDRPAVLPAAPVTGPVVRLQTIPPMGPRQRPSRRNVLLATGLGVVSAAVPAGINLARGPQKKVVAARPGPPQPIPLPTFLSGYDTAVSSLAFSPTADLLATGSAGDQILLWNTATRRRAGALKGPSPVSSVAFSQNGGLLAAGSGDRTVWVWNTATMRAAAQLTGHEGPVRGVVFSPDGTLLASCGDDDEVRLWDTTTWKQVRLLEGHQDVWSVAFSPDGKTLASGGWDHDVRLWNVSDGKSVATLTGHKEAVASVAFSKDGKHLASGSLDQTARLWDPGSHKSTGTLDSHTDIVCSVAFSPDGKTLATGGWDSQTRLWGVDDHRTRTSVRGHVGYVTAVAYSPDGAMLAMAGEDRTVQLWPVT
jgi:hypothetical protein